MSARSTVLWRGSAGTVCSVFALATALLARPALAQQSYNLANNPTVASGSVTIDRGVTVPGTEVYTIGSATAVIDMVPADTATGGGVINFQNANTTALYTSTPGGPAYTVLNRIVPADASRPIAFNGNVVSQLRNAAGAASRGGSVWFYSPGGIVVGDGAVFDVGNLLLSTGDPAGGGTTLGSTSTFNLTSTANGGGIVNILSGATINATNPGSYVALVAPIVFQRGTVNINGSAAYVAAEQASLTFNQGLFDINVTVGSSAANGFPLQHLGTTRFQNVTTPSRAYLVSVPKNDAITLVIGATADIGFDVATTVGVQNGLIVLGAGYRNVINTPNVATLDGLNNPAPVAADLRIDGGTFNAAVAGRARNQASLITTANTVFGSNVGLRGGTLAQAAASGTGTVLTIRGDLTLSASGDPIRSGAAQTGGTALLTALAGGTTQIGGAARLAAAGEEGIINIPGATGASTGGSARIVAQAGNISIGGTAQVAAPAFSASLATGGTAAVVTGAGFTTTVGGQLIVTANGLGLSETAAVGNASGGNARGGTATITTAGTLNVTGQVNVSATANGGNRLTAGAGSGGSATGGTATVTAQAGGSIAAGIIVVGAEATGGTTAGDGPGGAATAGTARLTAAGSVTAPSVFVQADATGGNRSAGAGATGAAVAGAATVEAIGAGVLTIAQEIGVVADAFGGRALGGTGSGADGGGGNARLTVSLGGRVVANAATIVAGGYGGNGDGAGGVGGAGTGGVVAITQTNGGSIGIVADARVAADGFGGAGAAAGGGRGGNANILANDGNLSVGTADVTAVGTGGNGDTGGGATGGTASILALNGQTRVAGAATVNAAAVGGTSNSGTGGAATGGTAQSGTNGTGAVVYGDAVSLQSIGLGGAGRDGGPGIGGTSVIYALRGSVTAAGPVVMTASGTGGTSIGIGTAGRGTGGLAYITADAGTVGLAGDADIDATGFGGVAATTSGNAGAAVGGRTQISVFANGQGGGGSIAIGGTTTIQSGALASPIQITATGNGGSATGGSTEIFANSGNITFNALVADAGAMSSTGADATATDAIGGAIFLNANGADIVAGTVSLNADASSFLGNTSTPRDGGSATGGRISVTAAAGRRVAVAQTLFASAVGRGGQTLDGGDRIAGAGTGGSIGISAVGTITAASIIGQADGFGGGPTSVIVSSGSNIGGLGTGGTVDISAVTGGVIGAGDISASAVGQGGIGGEIGGGGDALGGSATLGAYSGGSVAVTGATLIDAQAFGGQGSLSGVGAGGRGDGGGSQAASGGGAFLLASGGNVVLGSGQTWLRASSSGGPGYGGASGGVGTGGVAEVRAANGTIDARAGSLRVSSNGIGGDGVSGGSAGGAGFGGGSYVTGATSTAAAGQVGRVLLGNVNFASTGTGGAGAAGAPGQAGGDGGAGTGGLINLLAQAGNGVVIGTGAVSIQAGGFGGAGGAGGGAGGNGAAGRGGAGGVGTGGGGTTGTISLPATGFTTGSLTLNNLSAQAIGYGGLGGTAELPALGGAGGAGIGGNYVLLSRGAPVTLATASLQTMGIGGGSTSGVGGRGEGGEAAVEVTNRFQTSVRGALSVGQLSTFTSGQAGVLGAATLAGSSSILVRDGDARFGNVSISTAGDTPAALTNLNVSGGTLSARTLNIGAVGDIGLFTTATGLIDVGDATISTTGTLRFGDGTTGSNVPGEIEVVNLSASLGGDFIVDDDLAFGGDVILDIDGRIQTGAITSGGDTDLIGRNGIVTGDVRAGGGIFTSSDGDIRHGALASAKEVAVTGGGSVRTGAVTLTAYTGGTGPFGVEITARTGLTTGAVDSIEGIGLIARTGDLATGALTARTRDVVLLASGSVATGAVATATNGNVVVTNASQYRADPVTGDLDPALILASAPVRVGGAVTLGGDVTTGTFRSASSGATGAQGISAADTLFVDTGGGATLGAIAAGQAAYVGGTGAVSLTGAAVTRGRLTVDSAGNVAIGATQVGTEALLIARDARIDASAPITAGTSIALLADRGITTAALTGGRGDGAFVLLAGAGNRTRIGADGALPADFATGAAGAVSGAVAVGGAIGGGLIRSVVDGASRFDGAIDGARQVRLSSRGLAINGSVAAPSIELLSTDIALARGITVGGAATQSLALGTLSTAAPTTLGGAGGDATGGYVLDAAELAQLRSAAITFGQATTYGAGTQPLVVRDLTLSGTNAGQAANLTAANGAFAITAPGDIQLLGNVRLNAAGAGNALVFEAAGTFRLVTDTGSVGVFGTGDALAGRLAINARRIAAGDSQLVATVDPANVAAAIAAISAPAARTRAEGFLQAGRLELSASDSIVIQNSGTGALSGGFTAGSGGLRITGLQTGSGGTALIAYGRVQGEGGVFVTNAATRGAIIFAAGNGQGDPRAAFAAGSVVNGCSLIASVACGNTPAVQPTPPAREIAEITIGTDVQGVADGPLSLFPSLAQAGLDEGGVAAVPDVRLTTVIDASALKTDTIVNDPVGSGGNASLWEGGDADGGASGGDDGERRRTPSDGGNGR